MRLPARAHHWLRVHLRLALEEVRFAGAAVVPVGRPVQGRAAGRAEGEKP